MRTGIEFAAPSNWSEVEGGWPESIEDIGGWPVLGSIRLPLSVFPSKRLRRLETLLVADELFPSSVGDSEVLILLVFILVEGPWFCGGFLDCGEIDVGVLRFIFSKCVLQTQFWGCKVTLVW